MPCKAEIRRSFPTRDSAFLYLVSRGFLCTPGGWANGRWSAVLELRRGRYEMKVWLRSRAAA